MLCRKGWTGNSQQTMPELNSNICILLSLFRLYRLLDAHFPTRIRSFENGVAQVSWQLNPDGMYYMDEDGYGMTDDDEVEIYGFIDRKGNVIVKFKNIHEDWNLLKEMRKEAESIINK